MAEQSCRLGSEAVSANTKHTDSNNQLGLDRSSGSMTQTRWVCVTRLLLVLLGSPIASRPEVAVFSSWNPRSTRRTGGHIVCADGRARDTRWMSNVVVVRHVGKALGPEHGVARGCMANSLLVCVVASSILGTVPFLPAKQANNHPSIHLPAFIVTHPHYGD